MRLKPAVLDFAFARPANEDVARNMDSIAW